MFTCTRLPPATARFCTLYCRQLRKIKILTRELHQENTFQITAENNKCDMAAVNWPKVILFGDSLTQMSFSEEGCWGSMVTDNLQRKCDVLNRGFNGYTTKLCEIIWPRILKAEKAEAIAALTIFLGANDSCVASWNQHVPIAAYKEKLIKMVKDAEGAGVTLEKIILIGPPPCDCEKWERACKERGFSLNKEESLVESYSKACAEAATESQVDFVDLYHSMMKNKDWRKFLGDGLHLSKEGSAFLFKQLWPVLEKKTSNLPELLPNWKDIDPENPSASLLSNNGPVVPLLKTPV